MINFASDYIAGAHPEVLKRLVETNLENLTGYGTDEYCKEASKKIKETLKNPDAEVFFVAGGTQTNQLVISTMLDNFAGVISPATGHINVHEAGAIEYSGHKVLALPSENGKIKADTIDNYVAEFFKDDSYEHMVIPGMVYISFPTEYGTLYSKQELSDIYKVCKKHDLNLFIDGARLAYGLEGEGNDVSIEDLSKLCDVFYIGGTKCGTLLGEAVVFTHNNAPKRFVTLTKQHGAMLAKGRVMGVQFDALFTDNLYSKIGKYAIDKAKYLKEMVQRKGYKLFVDSPTNQQFIIVNNKKLKELEKEVIFSVWEKYDEDNTVIRFATSWSTTDEDLKTLESLL